jgi:hypothetical protein
VPVKEVGMVWRSAVGIELDEAERCKLEARTRRRKISRADAMRAEIVLLAADGRSNLAIAEQLGVTRVTVATWRQRFAAKRLDGLADEPRPGAPRRIWDEKIAEVVTTTLETMPAAATHWSTRSMAKAGFVGLDRTSHLAGVFAAAAPQRNLQAVDRSPLR